MDRRLPGRSIEEFGDAVREVSRAERIGEVASGRNDCYRASEIGPGERDSDEKAGEREGGDYEKISAAFAQRYHQSGGRIEF